MRKSLLLIILVSLTGIAKVVGAKEPVLIRTDRVWEYYLSDVDPNSTNGVYKTWTQYKFDGTEIRHDREYTRLMRISRVRTQEDFDFDTGPIVPEFNTDQVCVALLREENGKVYMLVESPEIYTYTGKEIPNTYNEFEAKRTVGGDEEVLLYDFSSPEDTEEIFLMQFNPCRTINSGDPDKKSFLSVETPGKIVTVENEILGSLGEVRKVCIRNGAYTSAAMDRPLMVDNKWDFTLEFKEGSSETYITARTEACTSVTLEGIGNIGLGNMISIGSQGYLDGRTGPGCYEEKLNYVFDDEGKIIYTGYDYQAPTPVGVGSLEPDVTTSPMFDLMGRRITKPLPGSVYIRDGKKYIGK